MSIASQRNQYAGSGEGDELQATPYTDSRSGVPQQSTEYQSEPENLSQKTALKKEICRSLGLSSNFEFHPVSIQSSVPSDSIKPLRSDPGNHVKQQMPTIAMPILDPDEESLPDGEIQQNQMAASGQTQVVRAPPEGKEHRTSSATAVMSADSSPSSRSLPASQIGALPAVAAATISMPQMQQRDGNGQHQHQQQIGTSAATAANNPRSRDYIKPLQEHDPRADGNDLQHQHQQGGLSSTAAGTNQNLQSCNPPQMQLQGNRQQHQTYREGGGGGNSIRGRGGGGQRGGRGRGPPPPYEETMRQSPDISRQARQSPSHSPGSHPEDITEALVQQFTGAMKLSPPGTINLTFNNFHQPLFQGSKNPVNFGGQQDSVYKQSSLTSATGDPNPRGVGQIMETGNPVNVGVGSQHVESYQMVQSSGETDVFRTGSDEGWIGGGNSGLQQKQSEAYPSSFPEDDPDVIIEEEIYYEEDGTVCDNQENPPSDSIVSVGPGHPATMAAQNNMTLNEKAHHTFNQSEVASSMLPTNQRNPYIAANQWQPVSAMNQLQLKGTYQDQGASVQSGTDTLFPKGHPVVSNQSDATRHDNEPTNQDAAQPHQSPLGASTLSHALSSNQSEEPQSVAETPIFSANQQECEPFFKPKATKSKSEGPVVQAKILKPHSFQEEVVYPAVQGYNVIIDTPAGTGKSSAITTLICREHLGHPKPEERQKRKIALIVPTVVLVTQVHNTLREYLPEVKVSKRSGEDLSKKSLKSLLHDSDILVMTPQILGNGLDRKIVAMSDFSLLLFDECHRAMKDSPYVHIMQVYLKLKLKRQDSATQLPQIVGLTASPSICGHTDEEKAQDCIMEMCANLDTQLIKTVQEYKEDLQEHTHTPAKEIKVVDKRQEDPFRDRVEEMMTQIEGALTGGQPLPVARGQQRYRSYVEEIYRKTLEGKRSDLEKCCRHLFEYNKVLQVLDLVRMKDAFEQLEEFHKRLHTPQDEMDQKLRYLYQENISYLWQLSQQEERFPNPKMAVLKQGILEEYDRSVKHGQEYRCMVFVDQRLLTAAIQDWMQQDKDLASLKPGILTGARASVDEGGMTKSQQDITIQQFRSGALKILISTSIGVEGLNIPACNMVISYSYSMDEVKMIQYRGRARAEDSVEMSVGTGESANKYEENIAVIEAMERAIEIIQNMPSREFHLKVSEKQKEILRQKEKSEEKKQQRLRENSPDDVRFLCKGCEDFVCYASDIRRAGTNASNFINPDSTFAYFKVDIRDHHDAEKRKRGIKKIYCKKCEQDWGNTFMGHPCLKIESFKCETKDGLRTFKKWKKVTFNIEKYEK